MDEPVAPDIQLVGLYRVVWPVVGGIMKKKITVRFVFERDFEVTVNDPEVGLGSCWNISDMMVSSGRGWGGTFKEASLFENPVSGWRPFQGKHPHDANLCNLTGDMLLDGGVSAWLYDDETDPDPWDDEEDDIETHCLIAE